MELVLDLGNTNKKLALFSGGRLTALEQHPTIALAAVKNFLRQHPGIRHAIFSSVIRYPESIVHYLNAHLALIELNEQTPLPIKTITGRLPHLAKTGSPPRWEEPQHSRMKMFS